MQSLGEDLLHQIGTWGLGSPFLFIPSKFRKGNSVREPADLAWVSKKAIILFYLSASETKDFDYVTDHNLRQAAGWLRMWRSSQKLHGGPGGALSFPDETPVYIVSAVSSKASFSKDYPSWTKQMGVAQCVSIPLDALCTLIRWGGGYQDLINLFLFVQKASVLTEKETEFWVSHYKDLAWKESGAATIWPDHAVDGRFIDVASVIHTVRRASLNETVPRSTQPLREIIVDSNLTQLYKLIYTVRHGLDDCLPDNAKSVLPYLSLTSIVAKETNLVNGLKRLGGHVTGFTVAKPIDIFAMGNKSSTFPKSKYLIGSSTIEFGQDKMQVVTCRIEALSKLALNLEKLINRPTCRYVFIFFLWVEGIMPIFAEFKESQPSCATPQSL